MKLKLAAVAAAALAATSAGAADVTSIRINTQVSDYLQIAELQLFSNGTNVALGKSATATSIYVNGPAVASNAVDGDTRGDYPFIFHSGNQDGSDSLTVDLGGTFNVQSVAIFGRTDSCCQFRDLYTYTLFNGADVVKTGTLDARTTSFAAAGVPEPASWAMMIGGFGLAGGALRRRKVRTAVTFA